MTNADNYWAADHESRMRFQARLDYARFDQNYDPLFLADSDEFYEDQLDWVERQDWIAKREKLGRARQTARVEGVISYVGAGISVIPFLAPIGIPLAAAASSAAAALPTPFLATQSPLLVSALDAGEHAYDVAGQVAQNIGTPGAKVLVDAAKVSVPGATAADQKAAEIDAAVTVASTATVIGTAGVGGLAGDVLDVSSKLTTQAAVFAARGDYSREADLEFAVAEASAVANFGTKELAGARSAVTSIVGKFTAAAQKAINYAKPLAPSPAPRRAAA